MGLCILYGTRGDYERAMEAGKRALQETERVHDVWLSALISLCMGITCIYNERLEKGLFYLEKTEALFSQCEDSFGQMLSSFWLSYIYFLEKRLDSFKEKVDKFLYMVHAYDFEFFFHKVSLFSPRDLQMVVPLLIDCVKGNIQKTILSKYFRI